MTAQVEQLRFARINRRRIILETRLARVLFILFAETLRAGRDQRRRDHSRQHKISVREHLVSFRVDGWRPELSVLHKKSWLKSNIWKTLSVGKGGLPPRFLFPQAIRP